MIIWLGAELCRFDRAAGEAPFVFPGQIPSHLAKRQLEFCSVQESLRFVALSISFARRSPSLRSGSQPQLLLLELFSEIKMFFSLFFFLRWGGVRWFVFSSSGALASESSSPVLLVLLVLSHSCVSPSIRHSRPRGRACQRWRPAPDQRD